MKWGERYRLTWASSFICGHKDETSIKWSRLPIFFFRNVGWIFWTNNKWIICIFMLWLIAVLHYSHIVTAVVYIPLFWLCQFDLYMYFLDFFGTHFWIENVFSKKKSRNSNAKNFIHLTKWNKNLPYAPTVKGKSKGF